MGKSEQVKGRGGELELCRILRGRGFPVRPGQAVSYGVEPDLVGLDGVHIECKRVEKLNLHRAMEQSIRDSERFLDVVPCLFFQFLDFRKDFLQGLILAVQFKDAHCHFLLLGEPLAAGGVAA